MRVLEKRHGGTTAQKLGVPCNTTGLNEEAIIISSRWVCLPFLLVCQVDITKADRERAWHVSGERTGKVILIFHDFESPQAFSPGRSGRHALS
jgi:hypothetical protein